MIIIGKLGTPYGILGWIHLISFTEKKKNIFNYFPWKLNKLNITIYKKDITIYKKHINNFIIKLKNINNRNQAFNISQQNILIKRTQLPKLKNKEYYWNDILSCYIFNLKGKKIGSVINIIDNKIYNTLLILCNKTNKNIYIPFIQPNIIKKINLKKKIIIVKWFHYK
ncbi:Ribosome maturation factor RimM [Buchnera aphidicola (Cinara piceae)]|uniref:Ribosome maturation factor RimM n=1 Tax=Buchnera aphidicola (Cinara piceae) TaxID=1660043 RepID=A0A803FU47_9GAMM|nr:ribosome maturation factor RimM [Buchnera aphidicola]VFP88491.1 Ribosome maturation factor RimM [Buchnera aphidicola (Cinara piceae)]